MYNICVRFYLHTVSICVQSFAQAQEARPTLVAVAIFSTFAMDLMIFVMLCCVLLICCILGAWWCYGAYLEDTYHFQKFQGHECMGHTLYNHGVTGLVGGIVIKLCDFVKEYNLLVN